MDPARMFKESLTSRPELENGQGHDPPYADRLRCRDKRRHHVGFLSFRPEAHLA